MLKGEVTLENPQRFAKPASLTQEKVQGAANRAVARLEKSLERFADKFPTTSKKRTNKYDEIEDVTWVTSLGTGMYWLAYEMTGNEAFCKAAEKHGEMCINTAKNNINLTDHDTGFKFSPSCVAQYKLTGNKEARAAALLAADSLLDSYCPESKFILRSGKYGEEIADWRCRTLVDTMLNIPLLFWAHEETGDKKYLDAAVGHYHTTAKYLIREDGSSYHHYQFDPKTYKPVGGVTLQGHSDDSCWSRGHAWLVYGYPIAYSYTKNEDIPAIDKAVSYYFLNQLPSDFVPYWDFDFKEGSLEPRDSSASAIAVCGLLEMCKYLPQGCEQRTIFENAADHMLCALIDKCEIKDENEDGLIAHVVCSKPHGMFVDTVATYGDYFYLEALMRKLKPDWKMYW